MNDDRPPELTLDLHASGAYAFAILQALAHLKTAGPATRLEIPVGPATEQAPADRG